MFVRRGGIGAQVQRGVVGRSNEKGITAVSGRVEVPHSLISVTVTSIAYRRVCDGSRSPTLKVRGVINQGGVVRKRDGVSKAGYSSTASISHKQPRRDHPLGGGWRPGFG